ncbi:MAG: hypothetical protein GQ535_00935 [Rhodobacteraceae bacterium]|nr:hypothetical protein [Paracoccaceae bacterium]
MRFALPIILALATPALADDRARELSFLAPLMPSALAEYGNLQVPAIENLDIVTENGEAFLELRMFEGQAMTLKGYRAEVSVDFPYAEGDTVVYAWRLRIPADSGADPENRWWLLGQWHDQPDRRIGESWDGFALRTPPVLLGYGHVDGQEVISLAYGAPDTLGVAYTALTRDVWHDLRVEIHWSTGADGWAKAFMDDMDTPFAEATGRNMFNSYQHFFKLGMYRHPDIQLNSRVQLDDLRIEIISD